MEKSEAFHEVEDTENVPTKKLDQPTERKVAPVVVGSGKTSFLAKAFNAFRNIKGVSLEKPEPEYEPTYTVAQLVCYHHNSGLSIEEISKEIFMDGDDIEWVVAQCKADGSYEENANALKG